VETVEQLNFLHANGCDLAQGYLLSCPLPVDEMAEWLGHYGKTMADSGNDTSKLSGALL
jgi:EAL domain-containing protein (putative c-di-GMP-specific phosphodiesterase class I)